MEESELVEWFTSDQNVDLEELLQDAMDQVVARLQADRGTIYLVDHARSELVSRIAHLPELSEIRLRLGEGVAGYVASTGELAHVRAGEPDPRFATRIDEATGYRTETMIAALDASGCDVVTVAIRRVDFKGGEDPVMAHLDRGRYTILPNTAGCFDAEDAVRVARLSRELGLGDWVKLEVLGDRKTLLPDPVGTLEACRTLVGEGFSVLAYTSDDPVMALRLQDAGATSVMPAS